MLDYIPTLTSIAGFILTAGGMLVVVTWRISQVAADLRKAIVEARDEIEAKQDVAASRDGRNSNGAAHQDP